MKKIIGSVAFTLGFISLVILAALIWIVDKRELRLEDKFLEDSIKGISSVSVQYDKDDIILIVQTNKNLNCAEVFQILDINSIVTKNQVYLPECTVINDKLIEIVFKPKAMQ